MRHIYSVRLAKEHFTFCSAHFITYAGDVCEPLHGHNYTAAVELEGPLDANQYVVDFIAARDAFALLTKRLDHRVILPTLHPMICVSQSADQREIEARFRDRRWVFPQDDCVLLPIANTTAELLAMHLGESLLQAFCARGEFKPRRIRVEVDECQGQLGIWEQMSEE